MKIIFDTTRLGDELWKQLGVPIDIHTRKFLVMKLFEPLNEKLSDRLSVSIVRSMRQM